MHKCKLYLHPLSASGTFLAMAKLIRPDQFLDHLAKIQGDRTDVQFAQDLGVARQSLYRLRKNARFLPSVAILDALGMEMLYRDKPVAPPATKAKKKAK